MPDHIHPATAPASQPTSTLDAAATDWHRPMLRELAELAMDAARRAHADLAQPVPDAPPADRPQPGLLFTRLARAVRQTVALDARLAAAATTTDAEHARHARTQARRREHRRADLRRRLAQTIRDAADPTDADSLLNDLDDRLDDSDIHAALDDTPPTMIIRKLCAEWGITPDLSTWSDAELAQAEERSGLCPEPRWGRGPQTPLGP